MVGHPALKATKLFFTPDILKILAMFDRVVDC